MHAPPADSILLMSILMSNTIIMLYVHDFGKVRHSYIGSDKLFYHKVSGCVNKVSGQFNPNETLASIQKNVK